MFLKDLLLTMLVALSARAAVLNVDNISLTVDEEQSIGTVIANLRNRANLDRQFGNIPLLFQLVTNDPFLSVNADTGDLRIAKTLDLESLCSVPSKCQGGGHHKFSVLVRNSGQTIVAQLDVMLNIRDINDNPPVFEASYEEIRKDESICTIIPHNCPNRKIDLPTAKDADYSKEFSTITYSFAKGTLSPHVLETFELKTDDYGSPFLYLVQPLDAEKTQYYQFDLVARDKQGLQGKTNVKIIINDDNDNSPKFSQKEYSLNVAEDVKKGTVVFKLVATDLDISSRLQYSMDPRSPDLSKSYFDVWSDGSIVIKTELDYETMQSFRFRVQVSDGRFNDKAQVNVQVIDRNDNAPQYSTPDTMQVMEGEEAGKLIAQVKVFDKDSGEMGVVECADSRTSSKNNDALEFRKTVVANTMDLLTKRKFDREREPFVTGTLVCWDKGRPSLTSTYTASVVVGDLNDHEPEFKMSGPDKRYIYGEVEENAPIGTQVMQIRATDADIGVNAKLTYEISPSSSNKDLFMLEKDTGILRTTQIFDRELQDVYNLKVEVRDSGDPQLTGVASVQIRILDTNDERPRFTGPSGFTLMENVNPKVALGTLTADDKDIGLNGQLFFTQLGSLAYTLFEVKENGTVYSLVSFDRERQSEYNIQVQISDRALMPHTLSMTTTILIKILDENDNPPVFKQPDEDEAIRISIYTHKAGSLVTRVIAEDSDEGDNGRVRYSLAGDSSRKFLIHPDTGEIKVAKDMGVTDLRRHKILVKASDCAPEKDRQTQMKVFYVDVNDAAPTPDPLNDAALAAAHTRRNVLIIIVLASVSAVLAVILIAAIICVNRPCCDPRRPRTNKRVPPPDDGYSEQSMHLTTMPMQDHLWNDGMIDPRSPYAQNAYLASTLASPTHHDGYTSLERQKYQNCTLPNTKSVKVSNGSNKPGKNDHVNCWLYQINEDPSAHIPQQNFCTVARSPAQNHNHQQQDVLADGAQSDSGRGCSDEDLTAAGAVKSTPSLGGNRVSGCWSDSNRSAGVLPTIHSSCPACNQRSVTNIPKTDRTTLHTSSQHPVTIDDPPTSHQSTTSPPTSPTPSDLRQQS